MEQRSEAWFEARLGCVTASRIADLMATTKSGPSASRANYAAQLVIERLTGRREESYVNAAMQRGIDAEARAREVYEFAAGVTVIETGYVPHPTLPGTGASPDGLVGEDGLVEIKCPTTATHIATLTGAPIADRYVKQMQWQMACTGRAWCDFASFDDRLPVEMQLHITRVPRDDAAIAAIHAAVADFLAEVDATVADLRARYMKETADA